MCGSGVRELFPQRETEGFCGLEAKWCVCRWSQLVNAAVAGAAPLPLDIIVLWMVSGWQDPAKLALTTSVYHRCWKMPASWSEAGYVLSCTEHPVCSPAALTGMYRSAPAPLQHASPKSKSAGGIIHYLSRTSVLHQHGGSGWSSWILAHPPSFSLSVFPIMCLVCWAAHWL